MNPLPFIQAGIGTAQAIIGGIRAQKAQKKMEKMVNAYQPNQSIMDFYNKALSRYSANPYESALYKQATQQADRGLTAGVSALGGRRGAIQGVGSLVQGRNDSLLKASVAAEGQQAQALGQLGTATGMKAQEQFRPFEMKYNLLGQKASGGNAILNSGISNIFGGIGSALKDDRMRMEFDPHYFDKRNARIAAKKEAKEAKKQNQQGSSGTYGL